MVGKNSFSVADPKFPRGRQALGLAQKLHENKRNWTEVPLGTANAFPDNYFQERC